MFAQSNLIITKAFRAIVLVQRIWWLSLHRASLGRTAPRQSQTIFGENVITEVHDLRDDGQTSQHHQRAEPNGRVEATEDFNACDPCPIGESAVHFCHQFVVSLAVGFSSKIRSINICKFDLAVTIPTFQKIDFTETQRTAAIEKDFNLHRFCSFFCHVSPQNFTSRFLSETAIAVKD